MANSNMGPALEEIGQLLAIDVQADPEGTVLYCEFGDGWLEPSIFKDFGDHVVWRAGSYALHERLTGLWEAEEPAKRWTTMLYEIRDGRFDVKFGYDEFTEKTVENVDRREILIQQRYGDKPINYIEPEWPD